MAKMRIYELAGQLNIQSKQITAYLKTQGVEKSASSNIEDSQIDMVRKQFSNKQNETPSGAHAVSERPTTTSENKGTVKHNIMNNQQTSNELNNNRNEGRENRPFNRDRNNDNRQGGYNRDRGNDNRQGGNREGQNANRPFNRDRNNDGQRPFNRDRNNDGNRQGGFNRDRNNDGNRQGGYNRDRNNDGQGGFNRDRNNDGNRPFNRERNNDGQRPFNRERNNDGNRQGGFNRERNNDGNRQGGFNRDGQRQGGYNRDGQGQNRQGGFNRDGQRQGGYNRDGQGQNRQGGFNRDRNNDGNRQGGFNRDRGGFGGGNSLNIPQSEGARPDSRRGNRRDDKDRSSKSSMVTDRFSMDRSNKDRKKIDVRDDYDEVEIKMPKKGAFIKPAPVVKEEKEDEVRTIILPEVVTIKELADKMKIQPSVIVKKLFLAGKMVSINSEITFEEAEEIALEYNCIAEQEVKVDVIAELLKEDEEDPATLESRPPVVCVMGHVDHGKTSLLDAIRATNVTSREAGGITQHIGAYVVEVNGEKITFLDTPGHEAFTSMRMRGAQATDIAILVVAADDGVMPQTVEAISHAKAAGVQIIVAINKCDKPSANIERVKQELVEYELVAEDWGGSTVMVPVSAHTKEGIEQLLEMIVLTAEIGELKANPNRRARGIVIEAQLDKGRGPVATVLVQKGTLHVGDNIAIGAAYGKVRAMMDDKGRRVKEATPSTPVEILGLNEVPTAGEILICTENDKEARSIAETFVAQSKEKLLADTKAKLSLDGLFSQIQAGNIKELNIIVKADVQGSVEAVKQSLLKLSNDEVAVRIIHGGVGAINESDVALASASNAIIIGFNVRPDNMAKEVADREKVDLRLYRVIYQAIEDVEAAMKGMLDPVYEEQVIGHAEVRATFKASGVGVIAGSYVLDGKIQRGCSVRITREGSQIFEGPLASLKIVKDDVKEVKKGFECGMVFEKFNDIKEGDIVEAYIMVEVPRK